MQTCGTTGGENTGRRRAQRTASVAEIRRAKAQQRADRKRLALQSGRVSPVPVRREKSPPKARKRLVKEDPITIGLFAFVTCSTIVPFVALVIFG